jgi:hypothetical protein
MTPIYFTDFFHLPADALEEAGAFNVSLINDLPLFVDPFLLFNSEKPEYQALHEQMLQYMRFLKDVTLTGQLSEPLLESLFTFREVKQNWLGFSRTGNSGRGLGREFAFALHKNFSAVFRDFGQEALTKSSHLEKLTLITDGVGRDMMSDFTTNLIKHFVANYTQKFAQEHLPQALRKNVSVPKVRFNYTTRTWAPQTFEPPYVAGDFVLLTPKDILTKDEAWINRSDLVNRFDDIANAVPNEVLRAQINDYFYRVLPRHPGGKDATKEETKDAIGKVIDQFPAILDYYIRDKEEHSEEASSVAKERVKLVEAVFGTHVREFVRDFLDPGGFYAIPRNTYEDAKRRLLFLKDVIENKGGHRIFYVRGQPIQREEDLHVLYRLTWFAPMSSVHPESDDGRGPPDFNISRGARDKTLVEFKLAKNTSLKRNLEKQAEVYEKAADATHPSLKAILYFSAEQLV